jgi:hypothetical protein
MMPIAPKKFPTFDFFIFITIFVKLIRQLIIIIYYYFVFLFYYLSISIYYQNNPLAFKLLKTLKIWRK